MPNARRDLALWWAGLLLLAGCQALPGTSGNGTASCPADFKTCQGAQDCFSTCMCETKNQSSCSKQCGPSDAPRVSDLDEASWQQDWTAFEDQVLELTNRARSKSGCCGQSDCFPAAGALTLDPALRRSARAHAADMAARNYFSHDTPEGLTPFDRMREAGFRGCALGENIAAGQPTPEVVVDSWLQSPGHCHNIRDPNFDRLGVGYHPLPGSKYGHFWAQNFGG
jgi:uncharacterized protein YkwD